MSGKITDNIGRSSGLVKAAAAGRMGTVDWVTTVQTGDFTAVSGKGYFVNTTSGGVTLTLPGSPSAGDIVSVKDYAYTFDTNALTIGVNGSKVGGGGDFNLTFSSEGAFMTFVYVDSTKGWLVTDNSTNVSHATETYMAATGGTIATEGDYKIHTFTSTGTLAVTAGAGPISKADYLVLAGGGGSNTSIGGSRTAGGGGAGGYRESVPSPAAWTGSPLANPGGAIPFVVGCYTVTVGAGGPYSPGNGSNSVLSTITSAGGGRSGSVGGSAGGGHHASTSPVGGNSPPVSPPQGNDGGRGYDSAHGSKGFGAGGGGGAGGDGGAADTNCSGAAGTGGAGIASCITASPVTRAGGGGGGASKGPAAPSYSAGAGPPGGGGGAGSIAPSAPGYSGTATSGTANTGGGAGGNGGSPSCSGTGGAGGSGIVIIRYRFQA